MGIGSCKVLEAKKVNSATKTNSLRSASGTSSESSEHPKRALIIQLTFEGSSSAVSTAIYASSYYYYYYYYYYCCYYYHDHYYMSLLCIIIFHIFHSYSFRAHSFEKSIFRRFRNLKDLHTFASLQTQKFHIYIFRYLNLFPKISVTFPKHFL